MAVRGDVHLRPHVDLRRRVVRDEWDRLGGALRIPRLVHAVGGGLTADGDVVLVLKLIWRERLLLLVHKIHVWMLGRLDDWTSDGR